MLLPECLTLVSIARTYITVFLLDSQQASPASGFFMVYQLSYVFAIPWNLFHMHLMHQSRRSWQLQKSKRCHNALSKSCCSLAWVQAEAVEIATRDVDEVEAQLFTLTLTDDGPNCAGQPSILWTSHAEFQQEVYQTHKRIWNQVTQEEY